MLIFGYALLVLYWAFNFIFGCPILLNTIVMAMNIILVIITLYTPPTKLDRKEV